MKTVVSSSGEPSCSPEQPLAGLKVLDLSRMLAGPYCTMILSDLGAEVIKVEPLSGEDGRNMGNLPELNGESFMYVSANINKKSLALDLESREGREIVERLVEKSDVVVENFLPRVKEKLGLDPQEWSRRKPEIIYCGISAFGSSGPYRNKPGLDIIFQAMGGVMGISGEPGGPPVKAGVPVADMSAAVFSALAIVTALLTREKSGKGQIIEISLLESLITLQGCMPTLYFSTGRDPEKLGTGSPVAVPSQAFETTDGYIALSCYNNKTWERLCAILDLAELARDERFNSNERRLAMRNEVIAALSAAISLRKSAELLGQLDESGIPCSPIYTYSQLFADPQVKGNRTVRSYCHPRSGPVELVSLPFKFGGLAFNSVQLPAPILGEHTEEILLSLGYGRETVEDYRQRGIVVSYRP